MSRDLVDPYVNGAEKLSLAIRGLTREDLLAPPPDGAGPETGKWTIQQVILHVADAELVITDRMKRVIAEDNPALLAFDENKWVTGLKYESQSAQDAADIVRL